MIRNLSVRYDDGEIARVLSKLGRTTARGKRWNQTRVAYTRKQYGIPAADKAHLDPHILSLGQAVKYTGVSDTTLMKLMNKDEKKSGPPTTRRIRRIDDITKRFKRGE